MSFASGTLLALCLCVVPLTGVLAVETTLLEDVVLHNWDLDDGLPSARINAVVRTFDGYLWLATHKGVVRFDGARFVVFDTSNTPGMEDDRVSCLLLSREGGLWAATYGGTLLKRVGQGFRAQNLGTIPPFSKPSGMAAGKVNDLAEDRQGGLWLAFEGMGLLCFRDGQATIFGTNNGLPSMDVRKLHYDTEGHLWVVAGGQLGLFQNGCWRVPSGVPPEAQTVRTISPARDGGLWVATGTVDPIASRDLRLYKLRKGKWSARLGPYPWPQDSQQFQRLAVIEDRSGRVWCAAAGSVFFRSPAGSWQQLLSAAPGVQVEVLCLAETENDTLWMGSRTTGLLQVEKRQVTAISLPAFARQHAVLTICASKDSSVWCGTDGAGIFRYETGQFVPFGPRQGLTSLHVAALLEDSRTNLWAGTDGGLFRRVGEKFEPVSGPAALREPILALLEDREGNLWTGGRAGLVRLSAEGGKYFGAEGETFGGAIRALAQDQYGRIWVGPNAGLYWLDGETFRYFPVPQESHLQGILALHCDRSGSLWIGTDLAGLLRLRGNTFDQWRWSPDGLPSNHLTSILEDDQGDLWMSSENGIFGFSKQALDNYERGVTPRLQPRRLTPEEGLAHKVCSGVAQPAACKSADGRLWFPNGPALAVFDPKAIPRSIRVRPPLVEGVVVDGASLDLNSGALQVRSGARRIDFQFTSPNLLAPEQLRFRFRLEGLEKEWVDAGSRREASYSQLPPGRYKFAVMARGPEDPWQEGMGALSLEITPRFWERRSVQIGAALALLTAVAGVGWAMEASRSRRRLERLELQRTLDGERQRIASDIHDDLGSGLTEIILLSDSLEDGVQPAPADQKTVGEISARARALTRAMDEVVWAINPRNDSVEGFLTYFGKFAQDYLGKANLRCRWVVPLEAHELPLSAEVRHNLYLACKEALHNIVKHSGASEVSVGLDPAEEGFTLIIEDNGKGFRNDHCTSRGNGLANMHRRLNDLRGSCRIESTGQGTRVLFCVPAPAIKNLMSS